MAGTYFIDTHRKGVDTMYKIAILDEDRTYLERLISFLEEHHGESFEIRAVNCLDDLDQDVTQYNALFFSDDVDVDAALFPADIAVGYLTEKRENDEQYISKYQSMEQIYRRMLKLCEESENTGTGGSVAAEPAGQEEQAAEGGGLRAETVTADGETYRIYYIGEDQVDRLAVRMLSGNRIKGLFQEEYQEGGVRICITGMKSLYEYIRKNNTPRGKERLLKFFGDMIATACSLEEYMLSADRLMLDPREIYVNQAEDRVLVPYIPVRSGEPQDSRQCLVQIRELCNILIGSISGEDSPAGKAEEKRTEDSDSPKRKEAAKAVRKTVIPYIVRMRTRERIPINRSPFKLGKDASCVDYCIGDNPAVSRNHAEIVRKQDGFYIVDKGSLNRTFVNGKKLAAEEYKKLEDGCLVQLADEVFEFRLKQEKGI